MEPHGPPREPLWFGRFLIWLLKLYDISTGNVGLIGRTFGFCMERKSGWFNFWKDTIWGTISGTCKVLTFSSSASIMPFLGSCQKYKEHMSRFAHWNINKEAVPKWSGTFILWLNSIQSALSSLPDFILELGTNSMGLTPLDAKVLGPNQESLVDGDHANISTIIHNDTYSANKSHVFYTWFFKWFHAVVNLLHRTLPLATGRSVANTSHSCSSHASAPGACDTIANVPNKNICIYMIYIYMIKAWWNHHFKGWWNHHFKPLIVMLSQTPFHQKNMDL